MARFGAHLSVTEFRRAATGRGARRREGETVTGPAAALRRAIELKCDCVQLFLRPNRQWHARPYTEAMVRQFAEAASEPVRRGGGPLGPVVSHAAYLINIAGPAVDVARRSKQALADELRRADQLGVPYVVLHPGNHMGAGEEAGLRRVVEALDEVLAEFADSPVELLLETTAGQGSAVGYRLEHLAWLIERAALPGKLGVCADTCHMFAAGYDLATADGYAATVEAMERTVGLGRVKVWHLNDALRECGSRVDRHAHIGRGRIGREGFRRMVTDPRWGNVPMILETPKEDAAGRAMDPVNLRLLRRLASS
jgi:deoxyribonuclease-4